jgi:hypothetical protein
MLVSLERQDSVASFRARDVDVGRNIGVVGRRHIVTFDTATPVRSGARKRNKDNFHFVTVAKRTG